MGRKYLVAAAGVCVVFVALVAVAVGGGTSPPAPAKPQVVAEAPQDRPEATAANTKATTEQATAIAPAPHEARTLTYEERVLRFIKCKDTSFEDRRTAVRELQVISGNARMRELGIAIPPNVGGLPVIYPPEGITPEDQAKLLKAIKEKKAERDAYEKTLKKYPTLDERKKLQHLTSNWYRLVKELREKVGFVGLRELGIKD